MRRRYTTHDDDTTSPCSHSWNSQYYDGHQIKAIMINRSKLKKRTNTRCCTSYMSVEALIVVCG